MSSASKPDKHCQCDSNEGTPRAKGGKLARRARSFKEDFLDILAQMRSPVGVRAGSPKPSPKHRTTSGSEAPPERERDPLNDLNLHVRQVQLALNHFSEVASNNKMEVLPNNGTVVLEIVTTIHSLLKTYVFIDQSSALVSATNQVYQSVARLIRLCDDVLLQGDKAITKESVTEVVKLVQDAVKNLVALASVKITEQNSKLVSAAKPEHRDHALTSVCSLDLPRSNSSRASLPEIPLTQREREILEQTTAVALRRLPHHSLSSESVLHDDNPPPKPPLPHRIWTNESPPPLPPKKRMAAPPVLLDDRTSLTSSMGSVDSMLNDNSSLRDDDELQALVDDDSSVNLESTQNDHGASGSLLNGSASCYCWDGSCSTLSREQNQDSPDLAPPAYTVVAERISSSSGFVSLRSSSQSYNYTSKSETKNLSEVKSISETKMQTQTLSVQRSSVTSSSGESQSSIITHNLSGAQSSVTLQNSDMSSVPPKLPVKQRSRRERLPSQYDNVPTSRDSSPTLPPPLPLKKKHIMAYMEMFGNCSQPNASEYMRHSVHTYSMLQREWQQDEVTLNTTQSSFNLITHHSTPSPEMRGVSPQSQLTQQSGEEAPPALPPKQRSDRQTVRPHSDPPPPKETDVSTVVAPLTPTLPVAPPVLLVPANAPSLVLPTAPAPASISPLELLDVAHLLVFKKPEEEGPDIRGGHPDALLILATKANKNDFLYQEAFLTTYRTFISPLELIEKLCRRHERFSRSKDVAKQRAAREAFSLLVRVVSDLTMNDFNQAVVQTLTDFVYQLLCRGDLIMAKALRVKILDKHDTKRLHNATCNLLSSQNVYTRQSSLLDFKSEHMAEQMTLLDSELFKKIEIPEVLIWAQEQNEERSPNLTRFTEHFNKMSYWARSRILEQSDAKDREKYVVRFIKIMKHLRKINNFNSYLALLSALDSAPIRRLEWQKHITEGLKEYCALIDSSSSFRAYRQALAETQPPCIPYIGLVLQDLTFVHIGNSDILFENVINFSKRWQQYNIVENMKRFKKGTYEFEKRERIIAFFSNFDEFLCEEAMWQISESIKPRGAKKAIR